jgi:hypothetical protein
MMDGGNKLLVVAAHAPCQPPRCGSTNMCSARYLKAARLSAASLMLVKALRALNRALPPTTEAGSIQASAVEGQEVRTIGVLGRGCLDVSA